MMRIKDITLRKTNGKQFVENGKNWFITIKFENDKSFGIELKPEMDLSKIVFELVKFTNLLAVNLTENIDK